MGVWIWAAQVPVGRVGVSCLDLLNDGAAMAFGRLLLRSCVRFVVPETRPDQAAAQRRLRGSAATGRHRGKRACRSCWGQKSSVAGRQLFPLYVVMTALLALASTGARRRLGGASSRARSLRVCRRSAVRWHRRGLGCSSSLRCGSSRSSSRCRSSAPSRWASRRLGRALRLVASRQ